MINIPDSFFPTDENGQALCPKCRLTLKACTCPSFDPNKPKTDLFTPTIKLDRSGRKGKLVTLVRGLPSDENYLKEASRTLKTKTGSGGTFYLEGELGVIEIQGDHKTKVEEWLRRENFGGRK